MLQRWRIAALAASGLLAVGCSTTQTMAPAPPRHLGPSGTALTGTASWYGPGFNGHRTSSGAIYDQEGMTAASVVFPLGTRLRVTNLANDREVEVTVNDHGPYAKGRSLDLSHKAAQRLGMIGPGTARVRMQVLQTPAGGTALGIRYYVRVASFADAARARRVRGDLAPSFPDVMLAEVTIGGTPHYRVQMGAFSDRNEAESRAMKLAKLGYSPLVVAE